MANIIKYESKIIKNIIFDLDGMIKNLNGYNHNEIKKILICCLEGLRDHKIE